MNYFLMILMLSVSPLAKLLAVYLVALLFNTLVLKKILLHNIDGMNLLDDEKEKKRKETLKKINSLNGIFSGLWLLGTAAILLFAASSPSALPKMEDQSGTSLSHIQEYNAEKSRRLKDVEINSDIAKNPMNFSGDESKKRVLELTDYKNKKFSSEDSEKVIDPEELSGSTTKDDVTDSDDNPEK